MPPLGRRWSSGASSQYGEGLIAPLGTAPDVAVGPEEQDAEQQDREADHGGALLLRRLANIARARGIRQFHATMLGDNRRAQSLVLGLSPTTKIRFEAGYLEADIPLKAS